MAAVVQLLPVEFRWLFGREVAPVVWHQREVRTISSRPCSFGYDVASGPHFLSHPPVTHRHEKDRSSSGLNRVSCCRL